MRKWTEHSANMRAMMRSKAGMFVKSEIIQGGSGEWVESALAMLAAAEARFMFLLVKLSRGDRHHEPEAFGTPGAVVP